MYSLALTPDGKRLFFGGHFGINRLRQEACGRPVQGIGALDPDNGKWLCDWLPPLQPEFSNGNGPWEMTMIGTDQLWAGGGFTHVSGVEQTNLARFTYDPELKLVNYEPKIDLDGPQSGGLDATYYDNMDFTGSKVSRVDETVNFDFGSGSPDAGIGPNTFSGRWTGQVEAPVSGEYTFTTRSDDGVRLLVEGETVIDNWTNHAPTDDSGTITLEAGKRYDINLDFYENTGGATIKLRWQPPGQPQEIVPAGNLFHTGDTGFSTEFPGGGPASVVDPAKLDVFDADDLELKSANITLTNRPDGDDESLSADPAGTSIVADYDLATGVLSLTGKASKDDYEKVLRTVVYDNASQNPSTVDREVTFQIHDGYDDSGVAKSAVRLAPPNSLPEINPIGGLSVEAGGNETVSIAATDPDPGDTIKLSVKNSPGFASLTDNGDGTGNLNLVPGKDSVGDHDVTVVASDGTGTTEESFEVTVTAASDADDTEPTVSNVKPRGKIRDKTPAIRAKIRDGESELTKGSVKLFVDGKRIKRFSYKQDTDRLSHTTKRLSKGQHRVRIVAVDKSGNKANKRWKFRITR